MEHPTLPQFKWNAFCSKDFSPALFIDCPSQNGVKGRVNVLADVLDNERLSASDGRLDIPQPLLLR